MLPPSGELEFLKFFDGFTQHLRSIRDPRKALAHALRDSREFFQATRGCIAVAEAGESDARLLFTVPRGMRPGISSTSAGSSATRTRRPAAI